MTLKDKYDELAEALSDLEATKRGLTKKNRKEAKRRVNTLVEHIRGHERMAKK